MSTWVWRYNWVKGNFVIWWRYWGKVGVETRCSWSVGGEWPRGQAIELADLNCWPQVRRMDSGLEVPHIVSDINFHHMGAYYNVCWLSREVHLFSLLLYKSHSLLTCIQNRYYVTSDVKALSNKFCKHFSSRSKKWYEPKASPTLTKLCKQPMT